MVKLADITDGYSFLFSMGFLQDETLYKPLEFGNATIIMVGTIFSLRFKRDRGQVFVDIGSNVMGWNKLECVLEFIDSSITQQQVGEPPDPLILANLLQKRWDKIITLYKDEKKMANLHEFCEKKSACFLNKIFGKR